MLKKSNGLKRTALKKVSEKKKQEDPQVKKDQQDKDKEFYMRVWNKRGPKCQNCNVPLFTDGPTTANCDHLIPKSIHPELRYEEENLFICCLQCHSNREAGFPGKLHKEAIDRAKEKFKIDKSAV